MQIGLYRKQYFCFSDEEGYHTGFGNEVLAAVCEAAGVECKTLIDVNEHCITSAGTGKDAFNVGGVGETKRSVLYPC